VSSKPLALFSRRNPDFETLYTKTETVLQVPGKLMMSQYRTALGNQRAGWFSSCQDSAILAECLTLPTRRDAQHHVPSINFAKGQVAETGGVGIFLVGPRGPSKLPGARPPNGKQIQVVRQALGSHHSWSVAVTKRRRGSGVDSMDHAVSACAGEAIGRHRRRTNYEQDRMQPSD